ncbi:MAG: bifunctional (p)ppGpp synthetase/guanosine-3',5'-bis(diphosphate) 3'-pyrophosphohydrolase [Butyrivibrio sp.]|jgi:GTP pyrophosphokinase|uniref:GTP diphosphokinase n=1 Tax=Butyrivibrio fibrisolvens TaxID=831 RepID=A0A317G3I2_BUTFI|nr:bifunctional (p)ppGpp synthetase/guanosine-3',5'-bis(diphosphate) 3'-pyrophosphohydrolase [Butyrivibrio fibrisolvens]MBQ1458637.1 bifunctional (p)ppGpp synthetase/guanosine-3',5'-bis(diphosphate) 3'-pyrophosphohydrolase [Butyrivibrio sp.]PWT28057.1 GTP pyrophosphokinase [Butyrivibrio fibrisolvens]
MLEQRFDDGKIESIEEFQPPERLYEGLIARVQKYHPSDDITMIEKAYNIAREAHKDQLRKSGEPYIIHPLCVSIILADLELDKETIAAGLLHDVVEDTILTKDEIDEQFGSDVALLVDGVTKLQSLQLPADYKDKTAEQLEMQAENLRKMFLAMAKDIRVILIKLADRLHNMRTLAHMPPEKQHRIAQETLDIYSPIAGRLGISKIKVELDDLSLKYLKPDIYKDLKEKVSEKKEEREAYVEKIAKDVEAAIKEAGIKGEVNGRVKHFFSIYKKMHNQGKTLDQIYDLFAVRIIVESVKDCYAALGIIHEMYKPIPGRFKDYIAMPKVNMYQSLHTTLIGPNGAPFEIQIRTFDMHRAAEYGIAAHWKYKEASDGKKIETQEEEKLVWLRQILEWQRDMSDNREFMNLLKSDLNLFSEDVYCFTPQGDVKNLQNGSTPIDFAYSIHSAVGNKMIGAKVNGKLVPIDYVIQNGDRIEILTSQNSKGPSRDWLAIAKSTSTKNKINQWFRSQQKEENVNHGKELIADYCKTKGIEISDITKTEYINIIIRKYGFHDWDAVLCAVGLGALKEGGIVNKLCELYERDHKKDLTDEEVLAAANVSNSPARINGSGNAIIVKGVHDVAVRFSRCCNPVPGDDIVGFVTRGRGVSIHRRDCVNVAEMTMEDKSRLIEARWESDGIIGSEKYTADIKIFANDRRGLLADVSRILTENNISILSLNTRTSKQGLATMDVSFQVSSREELVTVTDKLRQIDSVIDIERSTG